MDRKKCAAKTAHTTKALALPAVNTFEIRLEFIPLVHVSVLTDRC